MAHTTTGSELAAATHALEVQWRRLRAWVERVVVDDDAGVEDEPSVLDGWTVRDLVAHLGRSMDALAVCTPAPAGTVPLTLAEYLGTYHERAADIADLTRRLAAELGPDPLPQVDRWAAEAFAVVERLGPQDVVVQARRGPVLLSTMVRSRVIELVVHADDLHRSVRRVHPAAAGAGSADDPVDPTALALVADVLLGIVTAREGWSLDVADARTWVRLAAGRVPYDVDVLAEAVVTPAAADAVPDLGRVLPVL